MSAAWSSWTAGDGRPPTTDTKQVIPLMWTRRLPVGPGSKETRTREPCVPTRSTVPFVVIVKWIRRPNAAIGVSDSISRCESDDGCDGAIEVIHGGTRRGGTQVSTLAGAA